MENYGDAVVIFLVNFLRVNAKQMGLNDINDRLTLTQIPSLNSIALMACGDDHTMILDINGKLRQSRQSRADEVSLRAGLSGLWGCGLNNYGQLGLGDRINRFILTEIM